MRCRCLPLLRRGQVLRVHFCAFTLVPTHACIFRQRKVSPAHACITHTRTRPDARHTLPHAVPRRHAATSPHSARREHRSRKEHSAAPAGRPARLHCCPRAPVKVAGGRFALICFLLFLCVGRAQCMRRCVFAVLSFVPYIIYVMHMYLYVFSCVYIHKYLTAGGRGWWCQLWRESTGIVL